MTILAFTKYHTPVDMLLMTKNTGQQSQDHFEAYIRCQGKSYYLYRFEDQKDLYRMNAGKRVKAGGKPADFLVAWNGQTSLVDVKSTIDPIGFRLSDIRQVQKEHAMAFSASNNTYFFFIHALTGNRWYRVDWAFIRQVLEAGRKTIRWSEIEEFRYPELEKFK